MIHVHHFSFNSFQTRCSVVWDDNGICAITDPGCESEAEVARLKAFVAERGLKPCAIMLTHCHFDHIYGVSRLVEEFAAAEAGAERRLSLPVYMHEGEMFTLECTNPDVCGCYGLPLPDVSFTAGASFVKDGDVIEVGDLRFEVIETPGHSRGGLCFYERAYGVLFSGDTLFAGAIGRTDHPGGDYDQLMQSIQKKLMPLDVPSSEEGSAKRGSVTVIPGHGPCTDLTTEGMTNPFLLPFNEPYDD